MNVNLNSHGILPPIHPQDLSSAGGAGSVASCGGSGGWKVVEGGVDDLRGVHGDLEVSDEDLRRDDPIGRLVDRAFDPAAAAVAVHDLGLGTARNLTDSNC